MSFFSLKRNNPGEVFSWCFYDFANSAFATSIMAVIFNQYFAEVVAYGPEGTIWNILGMSVRIPGAALFQYTVVISMLLAAVMAPVLGAAADYTQGKKKYLAIFWLMGCLATALLYFVRSGDYIFGAILFIMANIGFAGGNVFYNGLLLNISDKEDLGKVSGWGWGLGYVGGGFCLVLNLLMLKNPQLLGLSKIEVYDTFPIVGLWWLIFALPLFFWVKELKELQNRSKINFLRVGFSRIRDTFKEIKRYRQLLRFFLAYLFYNEGIETTIITASIFGAEVIGLEPAELIVFFLIVQAAAFLGSLFFGFLVDKIGNKRALLFSILVWSIVLLWARFIGFCGSPLKEFYVLGILAGSVMGGSQSASRSLQGMFTPVHKGAEFFGFFGVCGKFSAMIGPFVYGTAVVLTGNIKSGIVALLAFFIFGGILLYFVDEQEGMKAAEEC